MKSEYYFKYVYCPMSAEFYCCWWHPRMQQWLPLSEQPLWKERDGYEPVVQKGIWMRFGETSETAVLCWFPEALAVIDLSMVPVQDDDDGPILLRDIFVFELFCI